MKHKIYLFLSLTFIQMISADLAIADWSSLVQQVTQLRTELEALHRDTEVVQKEKQTELDQWSQRRQEASQTLEREKLRSLQINEKIKRLQSKVKIQSKADPKATQKVLSWLENTQKTVSSSLPFQIERREGNLAQLKERVKKGVEPLEFIVADLWSFIEGEMKLTQTNEYRLLTVSLSGKEQKVEVARLGLQWMFAVTPQGEVFTMLKKSSGWQWVPVEESQQQSSVITMVQDLRNKQDSGYYQLPRLGDVVGASL